jgi:hypothetical protein
MAKGRKTGGRIKGVSKNKPKRHVLPPDTAKGLLDEAARALTLVSAPVRTPKAVMLDAMFRFENLGLGFLAKAEKLMKTRADPEKAAELAREGHRFIVAAVECATKAAPYIHARLLAVESRGDMTQDEAPFVIRVPSVVQASPAWQAAVMAEAAEIEASRPAIPPRPEVSAPVAAFAPPKPPAPPATTPVVLEADQDTSRIRAMPVGPVTIKPAGQDWLDSVMSEQKRKAG